MVNNAPKCFTFPRYANSDLRLPLFFRKRKRSYIAVILFFSAAWVATIPRPPDCEAGGLAPPTPPVWARGGRGRDDRSSYSLGRGDRNDMNARGDKDSGHLHRLEEE